MEAATAVQPLTLLAAQKKTSLWIYWVSKGSEPFFLSKHLIKLKATKILGVSYFTPFWMSQLYLMMLLLCPSPTNY